MVNKTNKPIEEILELCSEEFIDKQESRTIEGVVYNVVDWLKIEPTRITNKLRRMISEEFHTEKFKGTPPKIFFVYDHERRLFYFGLWNEELHNPVAPDPNDLRNMNYSYIFDLFFPKG